MIIPAAEDSTVVYHRPFSAGNINAGEGMAVKLTDRTDSSESDMSEGIFLRRQGADDIIQHSAVAGLDGFFDNRSAVELAHHAPAVGVKCAVCKERAQVVGDIRIIAGSKAKKLAHSYHRPILRIY